jgi:branched-chain amino acid transport system permease protein
MTTLATLTITGLTIGAVYGLVALGFVLLYKSTGVFNIAYGQLVVLGAFICYALAVQAGLPFFFAIPLTLLISFFLGFVIERLFMRPMIGQPLLGIIMMTIGLVSMLRGVVLAGWPTVQAIYPAYLPKQPLLIGEVLVPQINIWAFGIASVLLIAFGIFFRFTKVGMAMRATAENEQVAQTVGVNVERIFGLSWAISSAVAALAGILLATLLFLSINLEAIGLFSLSAVVVGGLESLPGAVIGGVIIGLVEQFSEGYLGDLVPGIKMVAPYVVLLLILIIRPYGLFGYRRIERI